MKITRASLDGVLIIEPPCFSDSRGFFVETFQQARYLDAGIGHDFVQDNHSRSSQHVLRGLHYQIRNPQAKLLTVIRGRVFDVGVDLRAGSATFGRWFGAELRDDGPRQMYNPEGFAHGFCVLSDWADLHYKVSRPYDPGDEGGLRWDDPEVGIQWPVDAPVINARDAAFPLLKDLSAAQLPRADGAGSARR